MNACQNTNNLTVEQYLNAHTTDTTMYRAFFAGVELRQKARQLKATGK